MLVSGSVLAAFSLTSFGDLELVHALDAMRAGDCRAALENMNAAGNREGRMWQEGAVVGARAALACGEPERALRFLEAVELPLIADQVWALRARAAERLGDWAQARDAWESVLASGRTGSEVEARVGVADAYFARRQWAEARDAYRRLDAVVQGSRKVSVRYALAEIADALGDTREATDLWSWVAYSHAEHPLSRLAEAHIAKLPQKVGFSQPMSRVDRYLGAHSVERAAQALDALKPAIANSRDQLAWDFRRGQLAYRMRDYPLAIDLFSRLAANSSGAVAQRYVGWLSQAHSASGQQAEALALQLKLAGSGSSQRHRKAFFMAAWLAHDGGQYDRAIELFEQFRQRYPGGASASEALWFAGWSAFRQGKLGLSRDAFTQMRRSYPTSALNKRCAYWIGRIDTLMGDAAQAVASYEATVALDATGYYGALAAFRLRELAALRTTEQAGIQFASLGATAPSAPVVVAGQGSRGAPLPSAEDVLLWEDDAAQRLQSLVRVGLFAQAALGVNDLRAAAGADTQQVDYARASLLYALGDYHGAFHRVVTRYEAVLDHEPTEKSLGIFRIAYPYAHGELVARATTGRAISPLLVLALMRQESAYEADARSSASAHGLMQIIPRTARLIAEELGVADFAPEMLEEPQTNVHFGAWYLGELVDNFLGSVPLAIAAYNAGPFAVSQWMLRPGHATATDEFIEDIPFRQTRHYVKQVLANLANYQRLEGQAFTLQETIPGQTLDSIDF